MRHLRSQSAWAKSVHKKFSDVRRAELDKSDNEQALVLMQRGKAYQDKLTALSKKEMARLGDCISKVRSPCCCCLS